jgi:hypothetical protein
LRVVRIPRADDFVEKDLTVGQNIQLKNLLDFSLELKKGGNLMVCSDAKYTHDQSITRPGFQFGKKEVRNRYYIVKKHHLKKNLFFLTLIFRMVLTLKDGILGDINSFKKLAGNLVALFSINNLDDSY